MAVSEIDYEKILRQIAEKDHVLEDSEDHSTTFKHLFDTAITNFADKKQKYNEVYLKAIAANFNLKSEKRLVGTIQARRLKFDEIMLNESQQIVSLEKQRDEMRKKYSETVDNYREKLLTIEEEFKPHIFQEQISEMKEVEKEIEIDIRELITQNKELDQRMAKFNESTPSFKALKQIKNQMFNQDKDLQSKQKELDNINTFIKDLKCKLEEV